MLRSRDDFVTSQPFSEKHLLPPMIFAIVWPCTSTLRRSMFMHNAACMHIVYNFIEYTVVVIYIVRRRQVVGAPAHAPLVACAQECIGESLGIAS